MGQQAGTRRTLGRARQDVYHWCGTREQGGAITKQAKVPKRIAAMCRGRPVSERMTLVTLRIQYLLSTILSDIPRNWASN